MLILLTVVAPGLLMAAPIEFQRDSNNQTYFFRFSEDGSNDEVHLLSEDKKSWRLLVQGQISRVYLPGVTAVEFPLSVPPDFLHSVPLCKNQISFIFL